MKKLKLLLVSLLLFNFLSAQELVSFSPGTFGPGVVFGNSSASSNESLKNCKNGSFCFKASMTNASGGLGWYEVGIANKSTPGNVLYSIRFSYSGMTTPTAQVVSNVPFSTLLAWSSFPCQTISSGDEFCFTRIGNEIKISQKNNPSCLVTVNTPAGILEDEIVFTYFGLNTIWNSEFVYDAGITKFDKCNDPELWVRTSNNQIRPQNNDDLVGIGIDATKKLDVNGEVKIRTVNTDTTSNNFLVLDGNGTIHQRNGQNLEDVLSNGNDANGNIITGLSSPINPTDAVNKSYVDASSDADWLNAFTGLPPTSASDYIYTNGLVGINQQNLGSSIHVKRPNVNIIPQFPFLQYNAIFENESCNPFSRNVLILGGGDCDWDHALTVGSGTTGSHTTPAFIMANGHANFAGTWIWSDKKFKTNIEPINSPLETVLKLNGKKYLFNHTPGADGIESFGFIAQEINKIIPELTREDNGTFAVNYDGFIPILTEAIKEQQKQIESKDLEIDQLKEKLSSLEEAVNAIRQDLSTICNEGCEGISKSTSINKNGTSKNGAWIEQNFPNPTPGISSVMYFIPSTAKNAELKITDLNGKVLKIIILDKNQERIEINLSSFMNGEYIYTMIVDSKVIDSKKLIVKK